MKHFQDIKKNVSSLIKGAHNIIDGEGIGLLSWSVAGAVLSFGSSLHHWRFACTLSFALIHFSAGMLKSAVLKDPLKPLIHRKWSSLPSLTTKT